MPSELSANPRVKLDRRYLSPSCKLQDTLLDFAATYPNAINKGPRSLFYAKMIVSAEKNTGPPIKSRMTDQSALSGMAAPQARKRYWGRGLSERSEFRSPCKRD